MARQPLRTVRATSAQLATYVGLSGEPVFNTDTGVTHWQDGQTPGGVPSVRPDRLGDVTVAPRYATVQRPLSDHFGDMVNLSDYCPGNAIDNDQSGLVKAVAAAAGKPLLVVPGKQFRPTATVPVTGGAPFTVFGYGTGFGPGVAVQDEARTSLIRPIFSDGPVFDVQGNYPCLFKDFRVDLHPNFRNGLPGSAGNNGPAFRIRGPNGGVNSSTVWDNVAIVGKDACIDMQGSFTPTIRGCKFMDWSGKAVSIRTYPGVEGNGGEITGCNWFGQGMNPAGSGACLYLEVGYTKVHSNFMGGGAYAVEIAVKGSNAGDLNIYDNTCEDQYTGTFRLTSQDGSTLTVFIERNWMSILSPAYASTFQQHIIVEDTGADWLVSSTIKGNRFRSALTPGSRYIWIQSGQDLDVDDNKLINIGPNSPRGIDVFSPVSSARLKAPIKVRRNGYYGTFSSRYAFTPDVVSFEHYDPDMIVGQLGDGALGAVRDGSRCYAIDGNPATFGNGGTGAFYRRQAGRWIP
ncbi:hypothetical protein ACQVP2_27225 [Methylobacterium aquaticum]|uniref:hypothetical protein n=1 Tax=Methylobacterium aquaticum TaxID=270351 RepID=UPI003D17711C